MKVCKVVINSVSHDARVLKEAEAVRDAGHDVVIIGIQDANNNIPIQILGNGVVIRRVAWQSEAFRPFFIAYLSKIALAVAVAMAVVLLGLQLPNLDWSVSSWLKDWLSQEHLLQLAGGLVVVSVLIFFGRQQLSVYWRKLKSHRTLRKREEDELLKYEAIFAVRKASHPAEMQSLPLSGSPGIPKRKGASAKRKVNKQATQFPRPFMRGFLKAFDPALMRQWKVIFARERCIYKMLEEEAPSIVHAHDLTALPVAAKYVQKVGAKLIFDAHEIYDHLAQAEDDMAELNSRLLKKYAPAVDRFITINDSIARYYANNYPALPAATVVKNAAKPADPVEYDGRLHEAAGLPRDRRIVIYQGGYAAKRGLIQLLMSAEYLNPDWSLVYMGWGKLEDELHRVADALMLKNPELSEKIRFVPRVKQDVLPYWTAGATIGAIPYENTGLNHWFCNPNKLWEYPNSGVPIIASLFPEMSAIINTYELGWYLPDPLNPKIIAEVINGLTDEQIATASQNCHKFMEADNWDVYARRVQSLYGELQ